MIAAPQAYTARQWMLKKKERGGKFYELLKKEKGHMPGT